jgi:hypothetical protein
MRPLKSQDNCPFRNNAGTNGTEPQRRVGDGVPRLGTTCGIRPGARGRKDTGLYLIKLDMVLARLKSDPRYAAFLRKMNLPE